MYITRALPKGAGGVRWRTLTILMYTPDVYTKPVNSLRTSCAKYQSSGRQAGEASRPSSSATKVPPLDPAVLVVIDDAPDDDMNPRKDLAQAVQADLAGEVRDEDDVILVHAVVDEHAHRHERRPAARHLRVQQEDEVVRADVRGQQLVVELWLARSEARLDQEPAGAAVRNDALEARL